MIKPSTVINNHPVYHLPEWKVYGPYTDKLSGKKHIVAYKNEQCRKTINYPRFILECIIGRSLTTEEIAHRKGKNKYIIVDKSKHRKLLRKYKRKIFTCPICKQFFWIEGNRLKWLYNNRKRAGSSYKGPFCSSKCRGNGRM